MAEKRAALNRAFLAKKAEKEALIDKLRQNSIQDYIDKLTDSEDSEDFYNESAQEEEGDEGDGLVA